MTNSSSFELENIGYTCYWLLPPTFQTSVMAKQPFGHLQFHNGVSTKTGRSFKNWGRKVREKKKKDTGFKKNFFFFFFFFFFEGLSGNLYIFSF